MFKLKQEYRHKKVATSTGHLIDNSFFNRYSNAEEIIRQNWKVMKKYFSADEEPVDQEEQAENTDEEQADTVDLEWTEASTAYTAREALEIIRGNSAEDLEGFLSEEEERKTVVKAYLEKVGEDGA